MIKKCQYCYWICRFRYVFFKDFFLPLNSQNAITVGNLPHPIEKVLNFWCIFSPCLCAFNSASFLFGGSWANELQYTTPWPQIRKLWLIILTCCCIRMGQLGLTLACVGWLFIYVFNFLFFRLCFSWPVIFLWPVSALVNFSKSFVNVCILGLSFSGILAGIFSMEKSQLRLYCILFRNYFIQIFMQFI